MFVKKPQKIFCNCNNKFVKIYLTIDTFIKQNTTLYFELVIRKHKTFI